MPATYACLHVKSQSAHCDQSQSTPYSQEAIQQQAVLKMFFLLQTEALGLEPISHLNHPVCSYSNQQFYILERWYHQLGLAF